MKVLIQENSKVDTNVRRYGYVGEAIANASNYVKSAFSWFYDKDNHADKEDPLKYSYVKKEKGALSGANDTELNANVNGKKKRKRNRNKKIQVRDGVKAIVDPGNQRNA